MYTALISSNVRSVVSRYCWAIYLAWWVLLLHVHASYQTKPRFGLAIQVLTHRPSPNIRASRGQPLESWQQCRSLSVQVYHLLLGTCTDSAGWAPSVCGPMVNQVVGLLSTSPSASTEHVHPEYNGPAQAPGIYPGLCGFQVPLIQPQAPILNPHYSECVPQFSRLVDLAQISIMFQHWNPLMPILYTVNDGTLWMQFMTMYTITDLVPPGIPAA